MSHEQFIKRAIDLSVEAVSDGNHPFGSILVLEEKEVLASKNTVHSEGDVTRHAELNLVSQATKLYSPEVLKNSTLYTST